MIVAAHEPEICRADQQAKGAGKSCGLESKCGVEAELFSSWVPQFLLLRPSANWVRLTHTMEGNLLRV